MIWTTIEKAVVRLGCTITHICIERYTTRMHIDRNRHTNAFKDVLNECIKYKKTVTHTYMHSRIYYMNVYKLALTHIWIKGYTTWMHMSCYREGRGKAGVHRDDNTYMHWKIYYTNAYKLKSTHICIQGYVTWMHINWHWPIYVFNDILHECIWTAAV